MTVYIAGWRRLLQVACVLACVVPPAAQAQGSHRPTARLYTFSHPAMATTFTLYLYSDGAGHAATVSEEVFDEIDRVEQLLSNYRETSELSRVNREAGTGPVTIDPEMLDFLTEAEHWSRVSDGAFDLTVGRLMKTWGFYRHQGALPSPQALQATRAVTGWRKVELEAATRTVRFAVNGVELDPGGIGKGFAVDAAVRVLRDLDVHAALLSAGSSTLYGLGAPPGRAGWRVVVPGPLPTRRVLTVITLRNESLSSADCTQKNFISNGHLYCHIMDPLTLQPVEGRVQVSIVHPSATASDALSNVIFVQTPQQSLRTLAEYAPEARALIVSDEAGQPSCAVFRLRRPVRCARGARRVQ